MPAPPGTVRVLTRPGMLLLHVAAIAAVVAAFLLGRWQVGAWELHREDRAAELADTPAVPLSEVMGADDPFPGDAVGRPVTVAGRWLPGSTVYVADRPHQGRTGFWMVTPLAQSADTAVPVVVGWTDAPDGDPPSGDAEVTGWLQPGDGTGPPDADPADDVLPALRIADVLQRVDRDLYGGYLILREPAAARTGLEPVTPDSLPKPSSFTALRNLLYGVEWWLFGLFAVFLWWRWVRDELTAARGEQAAPEPDGTTARIPSEP